MSIPVNDIASPGGSASRPPTGRFIPTYFAPPERRSGTDLDADVRRVVSNDFINGLMSIANGLLAVLNDKRQVVALNDAFVKLLGVEDIGTVLGLRPGELVNCVHAHEMPGGCGTSEYCATCGAVVSIMAAMETRKPQERTCALTIEKDNQQVDLYFSVRSCPVTLGDGLYVLLFLQDITLQQHRACLDRTFYHDINNILCALIGKSELISRHTQPTEDKLKELHHIVMRIAQEIAIQSELQKSLDASYKPLYSDVSVNDILTDLREIFDDHPLTAHRRFEVSPVSSDVVFSTDFHLVSRILINMVTNALEATPEGKAVTLSIEPLHNAVSFRVWNPGAIPEAIALRVFQRNFSTKEKMGRGFGTYSMKLFGEKVLGGMVSFTTSEADGTTFSFTLPTQ